MALTGRPKLTKAEAEKAKNRMLEYVDFLRMSQAEFCTTAGLDRRFLNTFSGNPGPNTRRLLEETYPALNLNWVLYGIGEKYNEGYEDNKKVVVPHRKPEPQSITTQIHGSNSGEVLNGVFDLSKDREPMTLDGIEGHGLTETINFSKLLIEKDKVIAEKDKMIQFLLDQIQKLGMPCK